MVKITLKKGKIIKFESDTTRIGSFFLYYNRVLSSISLLNVKKIGNNFLCCNKELSSISLPNVTCIGEDFLYLNKVLSSISLPNVTKTGNHFLWWNRVLEKFHAPKLENIDDCCLEDHPNRDSLITRRSYVEQHNWAREIKGKN